MIPSTVVDPLPSGLFLLRLQRLEARALPGATRTPPAPAQQAPDRRMRIGPLPQTGPSAARLGNERSTTDGIAECTIRWTSPHHGREVVDHRPGFRVD
jgi:hypothetical protein